MFTNKSGDDKGSINKGAINKGDVHEGLDVVGINKRDKCGLIDIGKSNVDEVVVDDTQVFGSFLPPWKAMVHIVLGCKSGHKSMSVEG